MDRDAFWNIIDDARKLSHNVDDVVPAVTAALEHLAPIEIVSFKQHQYDLLSESHRWDLWAIGYIVNGGCSDDGFDYFRAWLMANGSQRWKAAMENPQSVGEWAEAEVADCEDMLYVAIDAYNARTGDDFPYDKVHVDRPAEPVGDAWEEVDLPDLYPSLWEQYS